MKGNGIVVSLQGNKAKIKVTSSDTCQGCSSRCNCFGENPRSNEILVINEYGVHVDDHVVFEADTGKVVLSAVLVWILPLLSMFIGYWVASHFATGFLPIVAAILFLAGSFFLLKYIDTAVSGGKTFYPRITKILDSSDSNLPICDDYK